MKRNDNGDFCILYVEPTDNRTTLIQAIAGQKKPVVIMLAGQARVFQRPEDFSALKHVKRQLDVPIVFVIPGSERMTQMASRNGFPVYLSMDALADALAMGNLARQRSAIRATAPLASSAHTTKKTVPLPPLDEENLFRRTAPLPESASSGPLPAPRRSVPLPAAPPPLVAAPPRAQRASSRFPAVLAVLVILALLVAGLGSSLMLLHKIPDTPAAPAAPVVVGHIAFLSSEQVSENSSQGIDDEVLIDLNNVPRPAAQKSYYGWLLSDRNQSDTRAILLGMLPVNNGSIHLLYPGDKQHTNLLLVTSRFLVTEEDAAVPPIAPSPDESTWRYYGEFSQTPINSPENVNHFSFLDHLRHLLASDPTLDQMELPGGLNNWLYQNTSKVFEWATSSREPWEDARDVEFVRRMAVRILDYIDGVSFVQQDLPPNTPLLVNERLASVGLLEVAGPAQDPPAYLDHIVSHLNGLLQAAGTDPQLHQEATDIIAAMNNVKYWLTRVRQDAQQIIKMTDDQLRQPATLSLIDDMITGATNAYIGRADPATGQMQEGVIWIHDHMQALATLDISTFTAGSSYIQMIPDTRHVKALQDRQKVKA
jgi:hypothetical protein